MTTLTSVQVLRDFQGNPAFAVIPYQDYQKLITPKVEKTEHNPIDYIPNEVAGMLFTMGYTPIRAWREYLGLTQVQVAERLHISQPAYAQQESQKRPRHATRQKIAKAFGIEPELLAV